MNNKGKIDMATFSLKLSNELKYLFKILYAIYGTFAYLIIYKIIRKEKMKNVKL